MILYTKILGVPMLFGFIGAVTLLPQSQAILGINNVSRY